MLAYDADAAGQAAAERCYQWEQRFEMQFQVADLAGRARSRPTCGATIPKRWSSAVKGATPFLEFRIDRLLARRRPRRRSKGARTRGERAAAIIAEHPNELVRDQYVMKLAGRLDIDADRLRDDGRAHARSASARASRRAPPRRDAGARRRVDRRELDALRWAVHAPELMSGRLDATLFADPIARERVRRARRSWPWHECLEQASPEVAALLQRLAVEEPDDGVAPEELRRRGRGEPRRSVKSAAARVDAEARRPARVEVKSLLDALANARADEHWDAAEACSRAVGRVDHR